MIHSHIVRRHVGDEGEKGRGLMLWACCFIMITSLVHYCDGRTGKVYFNVDPILKSQMVLNPDRCCISFSSDTE